MDTEQAEVNPAEKVEKPRKVPALCNQGWLAATSSPTSMGEDEQVAIHHEKRGPYRDEP